MQVKVIDFYFPRTVIYTTSVFPVPPRAKSRKVEETVLALSGDTAKLKCPVKADPRPTFSWSKDGESLAAKSHRWAQGNY